MESVIKESGSQDTELLERIGDETHQFNANLKTRNRPPIPRCPSIPDVTEGRDEKRNVDAAFLRCHWRKLFSMNEDEEYFDEEDFDNVSGDSSEEEEEFDDIEDSAPARSRPKWIHVNSADYVIACCRRDELRRIAKFELNHKQRCRSGASYPQRKENALLLKISKQNASVLRTKVDI